MAYSNYLYRLFASVSQFLILYLYGISILVNICVSACLAVSCAFSLGLFCLSYSTQVCLFHFMLLLLLFRCLFSKKKEQQSVWLWENREVRVSGRTWGRRKSKHIAWKKIFSTKGKIKLNTCFIFQNWRNFPSSIN